MKKKRYLGIWLFFLFGLLLAACSSEEATYQWVKAPGWSRALGVGMTHVGDPAPAVLDEMGNSYFFVIEGEDAPRPRFLSYSPQMTLNWGVSLPVTLTLPDKPNLFWQRGGLDAYWLSGRALYYARLNADGDVLIAPTLLSNGQIEIDNFRVVYDEQGNADIWFAGVRRAPGLYQMMLRADGVATAAALVDAAGFAPQLALDQNNVVYAIWSHFPPGSSTLSVYYVDYPVGQYQRDPAQRILDVSVSTTSVVQGPQIGLDTNTVYLFWTIEVRTGPSTGAIESRYVTFPPGQPENMSPATLLSAPVTNDLAYEAWASEGFSAGSRVPHDESLYVLTSATKDVSRSESVGSELPVALLNTSVQYEYRQTNSQVALLFLENGQPTSYQLLSYSTGNARVPYLSADAANHLYLTWLEAADGGGFEVYYASTAPQTKAVLDDLTGRDYIQLLGVTVFGMLSGVVLSPLVVFLWMIAPMMIVGATLLVQRSYSEDRVTVGTVVSITLAVASYWVVKQFALPNIFVDVPFQTWIPIIPGALDEVLRIGVPVVVTLIGLVVAWYTTIRRHIVSPLYFMLVFGLVDGLLSMAVYGFYFYNLL
jgi:hypothetical protein